MDQKCMRRTLKRRIRKMMFLCTFITIFVFSAVVTLLAAEVFKGQAELVAEYFSISISQTMNSPYFLKQVEIRDLKDFDPQSVLAKEWLENLRTSQTSKVSLHDAKPAPTPVAAEASSYRHNKRNKDPKPTSFIMNLQTMMGTTIELNNQVIYSSTVNDPNNVLYALDKAYNEGTLRPKFVRSLIEFFGTECTQPLFAADRSEIGQVSVKMNSGFITFLFFAFAGAIMIATLAALSIAGLFARFLSLPITAPIVKLEEKIRCAASGDYESTLNAQIVLKRPLKEVQSLADSTNLILQKMKEYNEMLEGQKEKLEAQNFELEAQNEELEAQKEEIEAQNLELLEAKKQIEDAQTQLIQSENMAAIGQLTAAITHEINTPLGAINSNVQMCDMMLGMLTENDRVQSDEELANMVSTLKEANSISVMGCERVNDIIRSLKNFSRVDQADFQEVDINEGLKSVLVLTSNLWKRTITVHEEYGPLPLVKCYPGLLNQVFMNIIVNAIQSIEGTGNLFIKTYMDHDNAYISIRDTGSGIKEEHLSRIFDNGFTTKGCGAGMGLGLSICRNIIQKHQGEINVASEVGKGSEFVVRLPLENSRT